VLSCVAVELQKAEQEFNLTTRDYARLAEFRHALRRFLRFSEQAAAEAGLTMQHYQAMLVVRACPDGRRVSINELAQQLLIKHNSAVELVDRLEKGDLVARESSSADRRKVQLHMTPHGRQVLARLAAMHRAELRRVGPLLGRFFAELARAPAPPRAPRRARAG